MGNKKPRGIKNPGRGGFVQTQGTSRLGPGVGHGGSNQHQQPHQQMHPPPFQNGQPYDSHYSIWGSSFPGLSAPPPPSSSSSSTFDGSLDAFWGFDDPSSEASNTNSSSSTGGYSEERLIASQSPEFPHFLSDFPGLLGQVQQVPPVPPTGREMADSQNPMFPSSSSSSSSSMFWDPSVPSSRDEWERAVEEVAERMLDARLGPLTSKMEEMDDKLDFLYEYLSLKKKKSKKKKKKKQLQLQQQQQQQQQEEEEAREKQQEETANGRRGSRRDSREEEEEALKRRALEDREKRAKEAGSGQSSSQNGKERKEEEEESDSEDEAELRRQALRNQRLAAPSNFSQERLRTMEGRIKSFQSKLSHLDYLFGSSSSQWFESVSRMESDFRLVQALATRVQLLETMLFGQQQQVPPLSQAPPPPPSSSQPYMPSPINNPMNSSLNNPMNNPLNNPLPSSLPMNPTHTPFPSFPTNLPTPPQHPRQPNLAEKNPFQFPIGGTMEVSLSEDSKDKK